MTATFPSRFAWHGRRLLHAIGWPGIAALALLFVCSFVYLHVLLPLNESIGAVQREAEDLRTKVATRRVALAGKDPAMQLTEFYRFFPDSEAMATTLDRVFVAAAQENLTLEQGEYRLAKEQVGRLVRYDLTLPVKGPYPRLRRFIARALRENPSLALDGVSFSRQGVIDIGVDAQVRMTLYLRAEP
ncbi:MAG: hypothetical protein EG825_10975 [Rhodocyclaceae bacterium]|nr:hypothetical protein [Rhodocyclaceae bacterium]